MNPVDNPVDVEATEALRKRPVSPEVLKKFEEFLLEWRRAIYKGEMQCNDDAHQALVALGKSFGYPEEIGKQQMTMHYPFRTKVWTKEGMDRMVAKMKELFPESMEEVKNDPQTTENG